MERIHCVVGTQALVKIGTALVVADALTRSPSSRGSRGRLDSAILRRRALTRARSTPRQLGRALRDLEATVSFQRRQIDLENSTRFGVLRVG